MAKNNEKFLYADPIQQRTRTNNVLVLTYWVMTLYMIISQSIMVVFHLITNHMTTTIIIGGTLLLTITVTMVKKKDPSSDKVRWIAFGLLCIIIIISNLLSPGYYMMTASICSIGMYSLYYDKKFAQISCYTIAALLFVVNVIKHLVLSSMFSGISDIVSSYLMCFAAFLLCVLVTFTAKIGALYKDDMLGSLEEKEKIQSAMISDIMDLADKVEHGTIDAMDNMTKLNSSTNTVTEAMRNIATGTLNTAENIQEQSVMTQNIQTAIDDTIARSENMVEIAKKSSEINSHNIRLMDQLKDQSDAVTELSSQVSNTMEMLQEKAESVKGIADTIFAISAQTNLLALNASIESARAGEAGRGFAVVADEIRGLAEKTRTETETIAAILEELSANAADAATAVNKSAEATHTQEKYINEVATSFTEMNDNFNMLTDDISSVNNMIAGLAEANNKIVSSISELSATTEEVTASSTEAENVSIENLANATSTKEVLETVFEIAKQFEKYQQ